MVFEDMHPNCYLTCSKILGLYNDYGGGDQPAVREHRVINPLLIDSYPVGFFDGVAQGNKGGCGFRLWIDESHSFKGWTGVDGCLNNFSELVAAWAILFWSKRMNIKEIRIFGDSRVVIDWLDGKSAIHSINLLHWCDRIR